MFGFSALLRRGRFFGRLRQPNHHFPAGRAGDGEGHAAERAVAFGSVEHIAQADFAYMLVAAFALEALKHGAGAAMLFDKLRHTFFVLVRADVFEKTPQPQHHMLFPILHKQAAVWVEQEIVDEVGLLHLFAEPMGKQARGFFVPAHAVPQMVDDVGRMLHAVEQLLQVFLQLLLGHVAP